MTLVAYQSAFCQSKEEGCDIEPIITLCGTNSNAVEFIDFMPIYGECLAESNIDECSQKNIRVIILREARRMNIESQKTDLKAYIKFYVEKDGSVQEAIVAKSCGNIAFDSTALKIVMKLQDWQAVEHKGVPQKTVMVLPINFN